jgi:TolB-like protein
MSDIFLSYSRDDQPVARRFAEGFERAGFSVWWDQTLNAGDSYDKVTEKALEEARAVVVLWSRSSVDSRWVRAEATQASSNGTLVPVMIEACKRPIMFELVHTADLSHWHGESSDQGWQALVAGVRRFVEKGVAGAAASPVVQARPARRFGLGAAITAVVVLIAGVGLWAVSRKSDEPAVPAAVAGPAATAAVTLAVLPFVNLSSDPEQEYFSDGLTEEILNQLAQIKALRVTGRTSSFSFKGKNEDLRLIGQKLGVANLLEGSIRKDGNQVRITAQLINGKDGAHLWSQTYDRELNKVFALQEEIAKDVAQALSITLDVSDLNRSQGGTTSVEAYDKYLRGRQLVKQDAVEANGQAIALFREAVALDPSFSRAWLELNTALVTQGIFIPGETAALRREVAETGQRVRALAPSAWWARLLVANELKRQRKWSEAEAAMNAALSANAGRPVPLELVPSYIELMWSLGRVREGLELGERAMAQDPLAMNLARSVQPMLDCAGRSDDAQAEYERTRALVGSQGSLELWKLARMLMREDVDAASVRAQLHTVVLASKNSAVLLAPLAEHYKDRASSLPAVRQVFDDPSRLGVVALWTVAMIADRFGDKDLALAALRRTALEPQVPANVLWFPQRTGLRSDPRFKELVRELGLVDYWRSSGKWGDYCKPVGDDDFECH